jgi:GxxExxY protein
MGSNRFMSENTEVEEIGRQIIGAAIEVHRELGPGLLESSYERCLVHELTLRDIKAERQKPQPINYKGLELEEGYRLDILVEGKVVLELKVVDALNNVHTAQLLTYLKLANCRLGYLINFNVPVLKEGIKRIVNQMPNGVF